MKSFFFLICFGCLFACQNVPAPVPERIYSCHYQQDSSFDENDIDRMFASEYNSINETQLSDSIGWKEMKLIDSIFLKETRRMVYVYRNGTGLATDCHGYATKDKIKLIIYWSKEIDTDLIFVLKDQKFKKTIKELIRNERFIFNQLNESPLPPLPYLDN